MQKYMEFFNRQNFQEKNFLKKYNDRQAIIDT